jgi:hypothetical protein
MNNSDDIYKAIAALESRITKIENAISLKSDQVSSEQISRKPELKQKSKKSLEQQVGIFWLAKIGILVFAVGLIFIISLKFSGFPPITPSIMGFVFTALIFATRIYAKKWLAHIDTYFLSTGFILLFFSTLRLSHFSEEVVISNNFLEVLLLFVVVVSIYIYSFKYNSKSLLLLSTFLGYVTSLLISDSSISLIANLLISIIIVFASRKLNWPQYIIFGIILSYSCFFIWFAGNPLIGNIIEQNLIPTISLISVLGIFIIYALGLITKGDGKKEEFLKITSLFVNSLFAASAFLLSIYINAREDLAIYAFIAFLAFLILGIFSWIKERSKYATFFYSIIGYMLLSISIISGFEKTEFFIILSWQSLLVVTTAIWFRSKIIIIANFIIYLMILASFLVFSSEVTYISISFGVVALLSARILNWKKTQLNLNSEGMRNAYLICAFLIFPYTLYNSVPDGYITISWIGIGLVYYVLSVWLKNVKYRWLALSTFLLSVIYVIFFGASGMSTELRILTFIVLGIVLLITSIAYSKRKNSSDELVTENMKE